jgi:hypothetical protein
MDDNRLSIFSKIFIILLIIFSLIVAILNIVGGTVYNPSAFYFCIFGFLLFSVSKISQYSKGIWFRFGTHGMTNSMANLYRAGYWFMVVGIILTFIP